MRGLIIIVGMIAAAAPAASQTMDLRGRWTAEENGRACTVDLAGPSMFGGFGASSFGCAGALLSLNGYRVMGSELVLLGVGGRELARLSSERDGRLVGRTVSGASVALARANAAPVLTLPSPRRGRFSDCVRYGETDRCATPVDLQLPRDGSSVRMVARARVRQEPRLSAAPLGELPRDACVPVHECRAGQEGLWCSITFNGTRGWVTKVAPSADGQQMLYANGCGS